MKKAFFSTFLFILFLLILILFYLSFFGYETQKFNKLIQSEIKKSDKNIDLSFKKISVLLDIKKLTLFVRFIEPNLNYYKVLIPLEYLRTDLDLEKLFDKKVEVKRIIASTKKVDIVKIKPLLRKAKIDEKNLKLLKNGKVLLDSIELEFDENFKLKDNFKFTGAISNLYFTVSNEYEIKNLFSKFSYNKDSIILKEVSWNLDKDNINKKEFFSGKFNLNKINSKNEISLNFKTNQFSRFIQPNVLNFSFQKNSVVTVKSEIILNKNKYILFKYLDIKDKDNNFKILNLSLDKDLNIIDFKQLDIKTYSEGNINNQFSLKNLKKITVNGDFFDAKNLIKELNKETKKNKFLESINKDIEINLENVLKGTKFPVKNFRLIGKIKKGDFEKLSAKSDFSSNEHLDISLKKEKESKKKFLEIYSDIAMPLLSDYKFFQGLEGGNLTFLSTFDKKNSINHLTINNFKLNNAPALAKILTLADLKGLTDTLKGEGIAFETLSIKYKTNPLTMQIEEIFMIGPSISVLIDGYVEKKSGLISLRGTLVPAKTLNKIVSKIPVIGEILVGKKIGEGVFGLSFKIKGLPEDLKTTVNPIKSLAPRFITRALEESKKNKIKQQ